MASGFWTSKDLEADRQLTLPPHVARGAESDEVVQPIGRLVVLSEQAAWLDVMHMESGSPSRQAAVLARVPVSLPRHPTLNAPVRPVWMPAPTPPVPMLVGVRADVLVPAGCAAEASVLEPLLPVAHYEWTLALLAGPRHLRFATTRDGHPTLGCRQLRTVLRRLRLASRCGAARRLIARSRAEARLHAWRAVERRSARFTGASLPLPPTERGVLLTGGMSAVIGVLACTATEETRCALNIPRSSLKQCAAMRALNTNSVASRHVEIIPHSKRTGVA